MTRLNVHSTKLDNKYSDGINLHLDKVSNTINRQISFITYMTMLVVTFTSLTLILTAATATSGDQEPYREVQEYLRAAR